MLLCAIPTVLASIPGDQKSSDSVLYLDDSPVIKVDKTTTPMDLTPFVQILEDPDRTLQLSDIVSPRYASKFQALGRPRFTINNPASKYWIRLNFLLNSELPSQKMVIYLPYSTPDVISEINYYEPSASGEFRTVEAGRLEPFLGKEITTRYFAFYLTLSPNQLKSVYFHLDQSKLGASVPLYFQLVSELDFAHQNGRLMTGTATFYGIMMVFWLYNFFLFITIRQTLYFYYLLFLLSSIILLSSGNGILDQYFWPSSPSLNLPVFHFSWCLSWIGYLAFISHSLKLPETMPLLYKGFTLLYAGFAVLIATYLIAGRTPTLIQLRAILSVFTLLLVLLATLQAAFRRQPTASYLLIAEFIFISQFLLRNLAILDIWEEPGELILWGSPVAMVAEATLLSLVIAERTRIAMRETYENEKRALRAEAITLQAEALAMEAEAEKEREMVNAQQKVIEARESSLQLKNNFLTAISHELRTPMNAILGGLQVAQQHPLEHLKSPLDIVQHGATDLLRLINDILIHTEVQSDNIRINADNIAIKPLLDSLHQRYQTSCKEKGLRLEWLVNPAMPAWLSADEEKIVIILVKLLDNAVKYTERGVVKFTLTCDQGRSPWLLQATIQDSGMGIAEEEQGAIFEAFTQKESGFQRGFGGLGLGLSICRKLITALEGELSLESSLGKGCCFSVTLAVESGEAPQLDSVRMLASAELPILVVEDNLVNQKVMQMMLEKLGYSSMIAKHGEEALEVLDKETVSLILMDLQMPVMDGFSCTEEIRKRNDDIKDIPIIAVTANLMDADKERCIQSGMNDFLKKPVQLEILQASLSHYVEASKQA
ncbi:MAG: response regulator [Pseudomonadales bacterium]|nr:response regulator [Pseudomonadales bacterium]